MPLARQPVYVYGRRGLGFGRRAGWAPGFSRVNAYGYGAPFGPGYGFGHGLGYGSGFGYGYGYPAAGYAMQGPAYGGLRITDAPRDAEVYVDGYYAGVVDDFDGRFQRLNLEPGPHQIEVRVSESASPTFDVNVQPGRTVTYRAGLRP